MHMRCSKLFNSDVERCEIEGAQAMRYGRHAEFGHDSDSVSFEPHKGSVSRLSHVRFL